MYNFICANYVDGDSIILIGFSRGAFTARSVADMVASLGLLTPDGLDHFYAVFEDYENMGDRHRRADQFVVPALPEYGGQEGKEKIAWENSRMGQYRLGLKSVGLNHFPLSNTDVTESSKNPAPNSSATPGTRTPMA